MEQARKSVRVAKRQAEAKERQAEAEAAIDQAPGAFSCYACRMSKRFCDKVQPCSR